MRVYQKTQLALGRLQNAGAKPRFQVGWQATRAAAKSLSTTFIFIPVTLLPNPSVKRTPNGLARLRGQWYFPLRRAKPSGSAYRKRYASPAESESKLALFHSLPQAS